jgi:hypothetical protein
MKNVGFVSRMLMYPMVLNALSSVKIVYLGNRWGWVQQRKRLESCKMQQKPMVRALRGI